MTLKKLLSIGLLGSGLLASCTDGYDLADRDPEWLGSSIYNYLESNGNYSITTRMIDDLGYTNELAKTGSNTLFVADDEAYLRFFQNNAWGVKSYEQLSTTQKKLLLFGSLIKNACQVAYLSSRESEQGAPVEGDCMRRATRTTEYDTIPLLSYADMPKTQYWDYYLTNRKSIHCAYDFTATPMVHFIQAYLEHKLFTASDCEFLTNSAAGSYSLSDAFVNGVKMEEQNIKCSNGFIHKMAEVIIPLPNMAQVINQMPEATDYAKLLERFSAPFYAGESATKEYNRLYGTDIDSLFQKRYFSKRSQKGATLNTTQEGAPVDGLLKFDPGWNQYFSETTSNITSDVALKQNMAVMLVPTNEALKEYFDNSPLKSQYGTWDNVPDNVVAKLLNVNMMGSFSETIPSKFGTVLNDANDEMGLDASTIDEVKMACNGAIYVTNKVYKPVAYQSVSFPALIKNSMKIINWAIDQLNFDVYLNSQQSEYSFFIPDSAALERYIDPCSFALGKDTLQVFKFRYDMDAATEDKKVRAGIFTYDITTGEYIDSLGEASYDQIKDRLEDILDNHIVVGDVQSGNTYYQTKGGAMVKVANAASPLGGMTVQGSYQVNTEKKALTISDYYDFKSLGGNGHTYVLSGEPLMTDTASVYDILGQHPEFSEFLALLQTTPYLEEGTRTIGKNDVHSAPSRNLSLFNTFRYTVFVPTNEAIRQLQQSGKLPKWEDYDKEDDAVKKEKMQDKINMFVKYHIQDNSIFIGAGASSGEYETSAYKVVDDNLEYYKLNVSGDNSQISVTDAAGNTRHVVTANGLYNLQAREYLYDSDDASRANTIYTSSFAVIHQIDGALDYEKPTVESNKR